VKKLGIELKPWQGRTWFMAILLGLAIILNLVGLQYIVKVTSASNLEFQYTYNYRVQGYTGNYYGYSEDFSANGHYQVNYAGPVANAMGDVSWQITEWSWASIINQSSKTQHYNFHYSLANGHYISGTDQDYNTTGMNVWFQVPGGFKQVSGTYLVNATGSSTHDILDTKSYAIIGESTFWAGHIMPVKAIELLATGQFLRGPSDPFGNYIAQYTDKYYFTMAGYLLGEEYTESDYTSINGGAVFTLDSWVYVTSASYDRQIDIWTLLGAYWLPYAGLLALVFPIFDALRWRPRMVTLDGRLLKIYRSVPPELQFAIESNYTPLLQSFLLRGRASDALLVTASDASGGIFGLGIIDPEEEYGTFFCPEYLVEPMMKYSGVKYAFTEKQPPRLKKIEEYDVFRIDYLHERDINYDAGVVKPLAGKYLEPVMKMIAHEDYGRSNAYLSRWVMAAIKTDVAFVATAPLQAEWVRNVYAGIQDPKLKPAIIDDEVVVGVGFATPSGNSAWLYGLYVHPAFRNTGIGKSLVMARLAALKEMGVDTIITEIADWNGPARKIYARFSPLPAGKYYYLGTKMPKTQIHRH